MFKINILSLVAFKSIALWAFLILLFLSVPVVFAMLGASLLQFVHMGMPFRLSSTVGSIYSNVSSFPLMAVPFFILAGELMNLGFFTRALINVARAFLGHLRGGLAYVNIISSLLFSGLSGSAVADTSALGSVLIPAMEKNGYSRKFAAAVTAASSVIGPIIPPSGLMVLYAFYIDGVNVIDMFLGGIIPGLFIAIALIFVTYFMAKKHNFPISNEKASFKQRIQASGKAFFPMLTPIILLGSIFFSIASPTESAAIAVMYALLLNLVMMIAHRLGFIASFPFNFKMLGHVLKRTTVQTGVILLLVGAAGAYSQAITFAEIPALVTEFLKNVTDNKYLFLLILNITLLVVGMFLDAGPAILILGPILSKVAVVGYGVDPVHFAVIMCVNVTVGLATPPMGLVLFVATSVAREKFLAIVKEIIPFLLAEIAVILLITYCPILVTGLPNLFKFMAS